jgi:hypothetical protein
LERDQRANRQAGGAVHRLQTTIDKQEHSDSHVDHIAEQTGEHACERILDAHGEAFAGRALEALYLLWLHRKRAHRTDRLERLSGTRSAIAPSRPDAIVDFATPLRVDAIEQHNWSNCCEREHRETKRCRDAHHQRAQQLQCTTDSRAERRLHWLHHCPHVTAQSTSQLTARYAIKKCNVLHKNRSIQLVLDESAHLATGDGEAKRLQR